MTGSQYLIWGSVLLVGCGLLTYLVNLANSAVSEHPEHFPILSQGESDTDHDGPRTGPNWVTGANGSRIYTD